MAFAIGLPWHEGEHRAHSLLKVYEHDNPTLSFLAPRAAYRIQNDPLLAIGTLDAQNRPWTTVWGGEIGFARPVANSIIGVKTLVDGKYDPVVETLVGGEGREEGAIIKEEGKGRMVGGLSIKLDERHRWKLFGRMVAGALSKPNEKDENGSNDTLDDNSVREVQLVARIEQSLGNCPKYLNKKTIVPTKPSPKLVSTGPYLSQTAVDLISKADLFFISSSNADLDMDTNHRGGAPGFVRVLSSSDPSEPSTIVWPEYSGNQLYQTLGNLLTTPRAGLVFPDFDTGDALYFTGETEILAGKDAAALMPHSNVAVKLKITDHRFVSQSLAFRGKEGERSPYNPVVRPLVSESHLAAALNKAGNDTDITVKLVSQTKLTPTISRFRFSCTFPTGKIPYTGGQWVAMDFSEELDMGYSHMRDDDPLSINDDFVRTFTVSSPPELKEQKVDSGEFEITVRKVGPVTEFLSKQQRMGVELPLKGFGGDFKVEQDNKGTVTPFIAGGVGITPLLPQKGELDEKRMKIFWTIAKEDVGLVVDTLEHWPELAASTNVFLTGKDSSPDLDDQIKRLESLGTKVVVRRLQKEDFDLGESCPIWYTCTSPVLRNTLIDWLKGKKVVYEDFNF
ncbi:MAG: hypothetical protein M1820_007978 [Bogoriella megaspora]|nr:MAG: hypothetical protein M1820_007978 [Bogoriella megaspora]